MRAVLVERFGGCDVLEVAEVEAPMVGPGQVRISVKAAAVNPVDIVTRAGLLHRAALHDGVPVRLGRDVYGHVDAIGAGVRRSGVGQPVIALSDRLAAPSKTHAEQVVLDDAAVAAAPVELDGRIDLHPGQSVLVTGAGGAAGALAVHLAGHRGLHVVAAARADVADRSLELGADSFVEIGSGLGQCVRDLVPGGVDAALDTAGLGNSSLEAVRNGGVHVSLNVSVRPARLRSVRSESVAVTADGQQLAALAFLASSGATTVSIAHELALDEVRAAHELLAGGGVRGRIVLQP